MANDGNVGGRSVPLVVDLYHLDAVEDFGAAYQAGLRGVIHKASTGQTGQDELYAERRKTARAAGLLWGAYHWGTAMPAAKQVDNFLLCADPDETTLVALDFERTPDNQMDLAHAHDFLDILNHRLGRRAVLYSGETVKSSLGDRKDAFFGHHRLWLAQYGPTPQVQASWKRYWLWQYTNGSDGPGPKTVPGISGDANGELDCDHYAGSEAALRQEWAA